MQQESHKDLLVVYRDKVQPDWIDYNGHLNDAYYVVAFSRGLDGFMEAIGLNAEFREKQQVSMFTLQCMTHYFKEIDEGEAFTITCQLIDHDHNKVHLYLQMWHQETCEEHAAFEALMLHMNMRQRRSAPWLAETEEKVIAQFTQDQKRPQPDKVGASIGIRRKA